MKTKARKAYESKMPLSEVFLREEIQQQKHYLMLCKKMLANWNDLATGDSKGLTYRDANYIASQINDLLDSVKAHKRVLQALKNGLPQRRPKGVMAKCPFCGRRTVICSHLINGCGEAVYQTVCTWCGGRARMKEDKQDAIDAWNRRA